MKWWRIQMHTVVLQVFTILQARFYSYSEKCITPVSVTYWSFSAILKWGEVTPRWIFLVHWAPAERRGRPIKCHGDSIQQHVLWDVSASFSVSQVMKRVPGDVTHQLAAVTAPLCLSAPVWPLRWELQPHTQIHSMPPHFNHWRKSICESPMCQTNI